MVRVCYIVYVCFYRSGCRFPPSLPWMRSAFVSLDRRGYEGWGGIGILDEEEQSETSIGDSTRPRDPSSTSRSAPTSPRPWREVLRDMSATAALERRNLKTQVSSAAETDAPVAAKQPASFTIAVGRSLEAWDATSRAYLKVSNSNQTNRGPVFLCVIPDDEALMVYNGALYKFGEEQLPVYASGYSPCLLQPGTATARVEQLLIDAKCPGAGVEGLEVGEGEKKVKSAKLFPHIPTPCGGGPGHLLKHVPPRTYACMRKRST